MKIYSLVILFIFIVKSSKCQDNILSSSNELLYKIINECFNSDYSKCIKLNVYNYFNEHTDDNSARNINENEVDGGTAEDGADNLDEKILQRVQRYLMNHQFVLESKDAAIVYRPALDPSDFDIIYKQQEQGREMTDTGREDQDKTLMQLMMLMKMKMKLLMPIMMFMAKLKAHKALLISKFSLIIVVVFVVMQLMSKKGMMPMNMMAMPMPPAGVESATPPSSYGVPSSMTTSSYDPANNWEANSGGPYSRVWDGSSGSHGSVYSAYKPIYSSGYSNTGSYSSGYSSPVSSGSVGVSSSYQSSSYKK